MMHRQGELTVDRMCYLARVSRASFYRYLRRKSPREEEVELRSQMQQLSMENRLYGYRRICAGLRRRGFLVNHKKVLRLMCSDNLLVVRKRKFVVTTQSRHALPVYANHMAGTFLSRPNQLWVADITYIRLQNEFVYLAIVLDVYSRKVVGWALGRSLQASLCISALERAIESRNPGRGLIHHSDRGIQYASQEYTQLLQVNGVVGSMSRPGCPYDNAFCESFMKTLKQEEIYCTAYAGLEDLAAHLVEFIDNYYNFRRLHSSLGYRTPTEFERELPGQAMPILASEISG